MQLIRLGKTSKMRGYSFGLDARNCITGSKLRKVKGSVCAKCYAMKGNFNFPSVRKNKETNLLQKINKTYGEGKVDLQKGVFIKKK